MKTKHTPTEWPKTHTRPCPTGKCKHRHIKGSGPCTEIGCACHGKYPEFKASSKGGR